MKKFLLIAIASMVVSACQSDMFERGTLSEWWGSSDNSSSEPANQNTATQASVTIPKTAPMQHYDDDYERYRRNIVTKAMGEDYVVYEYVDVRIDEVATLAMHFCNETNPGKKAYLRDIYLAKNHKRRATFDCVHLASE